MNCPDLRCIVSTGSTGGWNLSDNVKTYKQNQDIGFGNLDIVYVTDDGAIYGITTDDEYAVLLNVPAGIKDLIVPEEISGHVPYWVNDKAFEDCGYITVQMSEHLMFPTGLLYEVNWSLKDDAENFTFSYNYLLTIELSSLVNEMRGSNEPRMSFNTSLIHSAEDLCRDSVTTFDEFANIAEYIDAEQVEFYGCWGHRVRYGISEFVDGLGDFEAQVIAEIYGPDSYFDDRYYTELGAAAYLGSDMQIYVSVVEVCY